MADGRDHRVRTTNGMRGPVRRKPASEYDPEGLDMPRVDNGYDNLRNNMRKGWNGTPPRKR